MVRWRGVGGERRAGSKGLGVGVGWGCCGGAHSPFEGGFCQPSSSFWHCTFFKEKTRLPWRQIWEQRGHLAKLS